MTEQNVEIGDVLLQQATDMFLLQQFVDPAGREWRVVDNSLQLLYTKHAMLVMADILSDTGVEYVCGTVIAITTDEGDCDVQAAYVVQDPHTGDFRLGLLTVERS